VNQDIDWEYMERLLMQPSDKAFIEYLKPLRRGRITQIYDKKKGMTLVHYGALKGSGSKIEIIINAAVEQGSSEKELRIWLNKQSKKDKFTALHFASFKGNLKGIKILVKFGSDINMKNAYGLSMVHVAAQGDAAASLYYFHKYKNLDIN
jgi:ankyrin repeat protein